MKKTHGRRPLLFLLLLLSVLTIFPSAAMAGKIKVKKIRFKKYSGTLTIHRNEKIKLKIKISPKNATKQTVKWFTSNKRVVKVSKKGVITGISSGKATITVRARDGSGVRAKLIVKVAKPARKIRLSVETPSASALKQNGKIYIKKGASASLAAAIIPAAANGQKLTYSSSNSSVVRVTSKGVIHAESIGTAVIRATATDGSEKYCDISVIVEPAPAAENEIYAHRGRSDMAPGNSMAAFRLAMASSFDGIELDIRVTKDKQFIVSHDGNLKGTCGVDKEVRDLTLAEAMALKITAGNNLAAYPNETLPSLEQVLTLAEQYPDKHLYIELKTVFYLPTLQKLLTAIRSHGLEERVRLISFYEDNLVNIRSLTALGGNTISLGWLIEQPTDKNVNTCISLRSHLCAGYYAVKKSHVKAMHDAGLTVNAWTVNRSDTAKNLISNYGVDSITSDHLLY